MLFRASAATVWENVLAKTLTPRLAASFPHSVGHRASDAEIRSWDASLPVLAADLIEAGLSKVEIIIEYKLPLTSKRVDVVLAGTHPSTGAPSYVFVELKQWSEAQALDDEPGLCYVPAYGKRAQLNPIEQVRRYCELAASFLGVLEGAPQSIVGAAYLHNATSASVETLRLLREDSHGRMFAGDQRNEFRQFLTACLSTDDGAAAADTLQKSRVSPSTQLIKVAAEEISQREKFILIDTQLLAYLEVLRAVENARAADSKKIVVITGGPGSGKSVIALSILGELYRRRYRALHATGSKSFTRTMRKVAGFRNKDVQKLFMYFNSFMDVERNSFDVLLCDEAHRLRETSANRYTPAWNRTAKPQIDELIDCARVPVFLLDEHQVVRPGELGTVAMINETGRKRGLEVIRVDLDAQFRCGGSRIYEEWVLSFLGIGGSEPIEWIGDDDFSLEVADSPEDLQAHLGARIAEGSTARITAGFCWPWNDPAEDGSLVHDVRIGDWSMPWNVKGDRAISGAPPSFLWASDEAGFGQIGCVYTAQGFEYNWNGVILGPDLVRRNNSWTIRAETSKDPAYRGLSDAEIRPLIRNVYKVLLTRGMVGTILYSVDEETQLYLRELIPTLVSDRISH